MPEYYDRQGNPLTLMQWAKRIEGDPAQAKCVAETTLPNGYWVSTVWLGLDHAFGDGPPLIFETMVFASETNLSDQDMDRYSTEADALAGHQRLCREWALKPAPSVDVVDPVGEKVTE